MDDEPWVDTTAPAQPTPVVDPSPAKTASPRKQVPIKREPTLQLPEVVEVSEDAPKPSNKRKSSAALSRRSSSGSVEETDDGKPKQRKIDEIFVKSEEDRAIVAERMHKQFDEAEAQQPKRTPSAVAMPPPAPHPRVKKAAPQVQTEAAGAQATSHYIANGPGPIIVASGLKTHNLVRCFLSLAAPTCFSISVSVTGSNQASSFKVWGRASRRSNERSHPSGCSSHRWSRLANNQVSTSGGHWRLGSVIPMDLGFTQGAEISPRVRVRDQGRQQDLGRATKVTQLQSEG
jgi:hypothetical protein